MKINITKSKKIVIYGLSTETERILHQWDGRYHVVGLLDGFKTSGEQFGYPILDINDVVKQDNIMIIVVARPGSCKAIAKRIGELCKENHVDLYDIRGKDLLTDCRVVYDFKEVTGYTKAELIDQVKKAEAVSFDLFDTLIVRDVLSFSDVIDLVKVRLEEKGIIIDNFVQKRIGTEKKLSVDAAPRLESIYEDLLKSESTISFGVEEFVDIEYGIDCELIRPRADMIALIDEVKKMGKKVYITTESYYSKRRIAYILEQNGILGIDDIIVSCKYNTGKTGDLFEILKSVAGTKNILHIGDDIVADIESAKRHEINSFQIYSSSELLDIVGGLNLVKEAKTLSDRIRIGMFMAAIFNSAFQFEDIERQIRVDTAEAIGYLFCAPMVFDFTYWFGKQVQEKGIENVLFCARDGYLLQKIYHKIYPDSNAKYFLTSRISAIRAGVSDNRDIRYVDSMKFSGTTEENLKVRFGINADRIPDKDINMAETGLMKYEKAILKAARVKRLNNKKYIDSFGLGDGKIGLFDLVAKGTSQMYIQKLVPNEIQGLYFLQLEPEFMQDKGLKIQPFYTESERESSAVFDNYYILETLLTSPEPSVEEFEENGNAVFAKETRSEKNIRTFMSAQEGILNYVDRYLKICPVDELQINKRLDEVFLLLIHNIKISHKEFLDLTVEDPFFNRMTSIMDVL